MQYTFATPGYALKDALKEPVAPLTDVLSVNVSAVTATRSVSSPTSWRALNKVIARIPNYRKGVATWVAGNPYGHYGTTNLVIRRIYISRSVPLSHLFSVAAHEYAHALSVAIYAGNRRTLDKGLAKYFHAGRAMNREYAADCMARLMGASWTNYTSCTVRRWRAAAATLLRGRRL